MNRREEFAPLIVVVVVVLLGAAFLGWSIGYWVWEGVRWHTGDYCAGNPG